MISLPPPGAAWRQIPPAVEISAPGNPQDGKMKEKTSAQIPKTFFPIHRIPSFKFGQIKWLLFPE
jgi:hypothetical protein